MIDTLRKVDDRRVGFAQGIRHRWATAPVVVKRVVILLGIVFLFYLPFIKYYPLAYLRTDLTSGGSDWSSVLFIVVIFCIIAVGLNVVMGLCGLLDLGYVGFFAIGAYTMALFGSPSSPVTTYLQNRFDLSDEWAVAWAALIPLAMALTMMSGVILGALPVVFAVYLILVRPEYINPLFTTPMGLVLLGIGCVTLVIGAFWMSKVIKVEV